MEQLLVILLIKLAAASSIASLLSRSSRFLNLLLKEDRSMIERLELSAGISLFCALGSLVRLSTRTYTAADISLEGSMICGLVGGYISGLVGGVVCALPATIFGGEYLAMPLCAAVGVLGGLVRDLAPQPNEIWRFTPFFDLSVYRLVRYPQDRARSAYHLVVLASILLAEAMRFVSWRLFGENLIFTLYPRASLGVVIAIFISTVFIVAIPLKIWNSARNERLLDAKERLLVQARLSALSSQINPHFLFNTLNTVSSLIRTNPDAARGVVYRLSSILRRLLRKTDNFSPLRDELAFIDDYLSIETARFGDKVFFQKEIDDETLDCQIPSMLLQPLVENSIKHGLAPKVQGGRVVIRSRLVPHPDSDSQPHRLLLSVEDNGVGIEEERLNTLLERAGIGVSNVNERLHVLFGSNYRLSIYSQPGEGTRTEIELPA